MSIIKRIFWSLLAILFPWVILLLDDNPGGALVAIILQISVIGWIPASIWALRIVNQPTDEPPTSSGTNAESKNPKETSGE